MLDDNCLPLYGLTQASSEMWAMVSLKAPAQGRRTELQLDSRQSPGGEQEEWASWTHRQDRSFHLTRIFSSCLLNALGKDYNGIEMGPGKIGGREEINLGEIIIF